jgi:hypothetical protein
MSRRIQAKHLAYADNRVADAESHTGFSGFALLTVKVDALRIAYYAVDPSAATPAVVVLEEEFDLDQLGNVTKPTVVAPPPRHRDFFTPTNRP